MRRRWPAPEKWRGTGVQRPLCVERFSSAELVADTPYGLQVAGPRRVWLDLLAQSPHVHGNGARVRGEGITPHQLHELVARVDPARARGQPVQEVEFRGRKRYRVSPHQDLARVRIYPQSVEGDHPLIPWSGRFLHAPQDRGDPRGQLPRGEWFHDVVICTQ